MTNPIAFIPEGKTVYWISLSMPDKVASGTVLGAAKNDKKCVKVKNKEGRVQFISKKYLHYTEQAARANVTNHLEGKVSSAKAALNTAEQELASWKKRTC